MKIQRISSSMLGIVAIACLGLILSACDQFMTKDSSAKAEMSGKPSVDDMIAMSMQNMEKIMMMSPDERKKYVMKTQGESMQHGKALFADAKLGSNGFSCATCHPSGRTTGGKVPMGKMQMPIPTLEGVASNFPKFKVPNNAVISLAEMNNNCVVMFLKGQPLPLGSQAARDLTMYVTSLSKGKPMSPGKQNMM